MYPFSAIFSPSFTVEAKTSVSVIKWSEGTTKITGSTLNLSRMYLEAKAIAGAVFLEIGSDKTIAFLFKEES